MLQVVKNCVAFFGMPAGDCCVVGNGLRAGGVLRGLRGRPGGATLAREGVGGVKGRRG